MKKISFSILLFAILGLGMISCSSDDDNDNDNAENLSSSVYQAVDLGLSVKWANCNVGASSPEGYGGLYGWADPTGTKTSEDLDDYPSSNPPSNICGTSYDIARVKWGGSWRLPTCTEQQELCTKCTWTWITYQSVNGYKVVGPNGNSIFLPAAGFRDGAGVRTQGSGGNYWSGSLWSGYSSSAYDLYFHSSGVDRWSGSKRYDGQSVRPVTE